MMSDNSRVKFIQICSSGGIVYGLDSAGKVWKQNNDEWEIFTDYKKRGNDDGRRRTYEENFPEKTDKLFGIF